MYQLRNYCINNAFKNPWWRHNMDTFCISAACESNPPIVVSSAPLTKDYQWRALVFLCCKPAQPVEPTVKLPMGCHDVHVSLWYFHRFCITFYIASYIQKSAKVRCWRIPIPYLFHKKTKFNVLHHASSTHRHQRYLRKSDPASHISPSYKECIWLEYHVWSWCCKIYLL